MHIHAVSQQVAAVVAIEDNAGAVQQRDVAVDLDLLFLTSSFLPYLNGSREASRR